MHPTVLAIFLEISRTATSMSAAGLVLLLIGLWAAKSDLATASGLDKVVALANLCFAVPLAVFGAEHFSAAKGIMQLVPKFMPSPLFWTYFVGIALMAASLSIAMKIQVHWSGLLFGIMMFLFVATMDLPGALANVHNRISWVLLCRELSFGAGGWVLAGGAMQPGRGQSRSKLVAVGSVIIAIAAIFYGVEHFLHPLNVPGVPLEKLMPEWIPARSLISYVTGTILLFGSACILIGKQARTAATYLGIWILLVVIFIYGPILIASLLNPDTGVKVEGLNYFFDTLLYAGAVLALANAEAHQRNATAEEAVGLSAA